MIPTKQQIEVLKRGETLEIEKEWVECYDCIYWKTSFRDVSFCQRCNDKGKIPKYKVGDEIVLIIDVNEVTKYEETTITIEKRTIKLKIISETEDKSRVILWEK